MQAKAKFICQSPHFDNAQFERMINNNLAQRIKLAQGEVTYNYEEIDNIEKLDRRLFPLGYELSKETEETIRAIAKFSQCELKPKVNISSHRKLVGPLIVLLKKISWPFVKIHLQDTMNTQQEFNTYLIYLLAEQSKLIDSLSNRIESIESTQKNY